MSLCPVALSQPVRLDPTIYACAFQAGRTNMVVGAGLAPSPPTAGCAGGGGGGARGGGAADGGTMTVVNTVAVAVAVLLAAAGPLGRTAFARGIAPTMPPATDRAGTLARATAAALK